MFRDLAVGSLGGVHHLPLLPHVPVEQGCVSLDRLDVIGGQ